MGKREKDVLNNPEGVLVIRKVNEEYSDVCIYIDEDSLYNYLVSKYVWEGISYSLTPPP